MVRDCVTYHHGHRSVDDTVCVYFDRVAPMKYDSYTNALVWFLLLTVNLLLLNTPILCEKIPSYMLTQEYRVKDIAFEPVVQVVSVDKLYFEEPRTINLFVEEKKLVVEKEIKQSKTKASKNTYQAEYSEKELLALLAYCEAGNQGIEGMRRVISVVLNRVEDPAFPNNVHDVIFAKGQFSVASNGSMANSVASDEARQAVELEMETRIDPNSLYFGRSPHSNDGLYKYGAHYFSR